MGYVHKVKFQRIFLRSWLIASIFHMGHLNHALEKYLYCCEKEILNAQLYN